MAVTVKFNRWASGLGRYAYRAVGLWPKGVP